MPFCVSVLLTTQRFARLLGEVAVPRAGEHVADLGRQPRVVLEAAVRLVGVLIVGLALVAITQPFLPSYTGALVLLVALVVLAFAFWRKTGALEGHVRAAAQAVIEALAAQSAAHVGARGSHDPMEQARTLFPGLGAPVRFEIHDGTAAVGRSLADLELRAVTGATVLALLRDGAGMAVPDAHEPLRAGDVLAIAGSDDAIAAAVGVLDAHGHASS